MKDPGEENDPAGAAKFLFEDRHIMTREKCEGNRFRIVSHNILYDFGRRFQYESEFTFAHCPPQYLEMKYRLPLIIKEISGYNGDIICLQEVDPPTFHDHLEPAFSKIGLKGSFIPKDDGTDGLATFYKSNRFRVMKTEKMILRKALREERFQDLWEKIEKNPTFTEKFMDEHRPLLATVLQSVEYPSKYLLVGNIHIHHTLTGCHIRIIQIEIILRELRRIKAEFMKEHNIVEEDITTIMAGDFNTLPYTAVIQLITKGDIQSNHLEWYTGGKAEFLPGMHLTNPVLFDSASGYPEYTNVYLGELKHLDYIFIDPNRISVEKVIPPPSHDDVIKYSAIPSMTYPSDHIAQVVDLSWKKRN